MLYIKETNGTSKLSPTTDLSKLEQQISNLQNEVTALKNKVDPISATTFIGQYGQEWLLTSTYMKTGNNRPSVDDEYYKTTTGDSWITVKTPGYYIVNFNGLYLNKGNGGRVWVQLVRKSVVVRTYVQYIYGYGGSIAFTSYWWLQPDWPISAQISSDSSELYSSGNEELEIIKLN